MMPPKKQIPAAAGDPDGSGQLDPAHHGGGTPSTGPAFPPIDQQDGGLLGPGLLEDAGIDPDPTDGGGGPPVVTPPPAPTQVQLSRPDDGATPDQNLWTLIRNRTDAISFNNYSRFLDAVLDGQPKAAGSLSTAIGSEIADLSFLGLDGYEVVRAATEFFLMHEVGLVVDDSTNPRHPNQVLDSTYLQQRYDRAIGSTPAADTAEFRRRNNHQLSATWLSDLQRDYLVQLTSTATPKVLPYLSSVVRRLADLPLKAPGEVGSSYGVLPSRLVGPLGLELIWSYWHEEGMLVQAHNAITNRFQNIRSTRSARDPLARLEIDPLRRLNNIIWGWIQNRPFQLTVRRRSFEYDHQYGITLLGTAAGEVQSADSRSQFISAFHNLLHLCMIFYLQDDDLTVKSDGFPIMNALRETQLVLTAGAHNQYGDLPWTARVEMLIQMWMLGRPEMREFLGGRIMVPYKEGWMDRVDAVKSMMDWTDVNVTHFRDLGVFGEQILLSIRYGSWSTEIDPTAAVNWARYWRPEIQGYLHAYRAATGADLRQGVDTTMPGRLLADRLEAGPAAVRGAPSRRALPSAAAQPQRRGFRSSRAEALPLEAGHELP
jgi:hypothetical protein